MIDTIKRLWGIRYVRAMIFCYKVNRHYHVWHSAGFGGWWTEYELNHWQDIKDGKA